MKKVYLIIFAVSLVTGLQSQSTFHKSLAIAGKDGFLYRTQHTTDGGFVSVGRLIDGTTSENDFLIIKTDAAGNSSWIKQYSTTDFEEFTDAVEIAGGGLVAVGTSTNMTTFISTAVVKKLNDAGVSQWTKTYGISGHSCGAKKISKDENGNLYVLGSVAVDGASDDYFIMKLDAGGNILSQTTFGTPDYDFPLAFVRKGNGDLFICGWDNTFSGENIHILKINANMTLAWNKKISGPILYFAYDMQERADGDLVLAGRYDDGGTSYDVLICTLDDITGEQVWAKTYSSSDNFGIYAYGVTVASGDVIAVTGPAETTDKGTFLLATDATGNLSWSNRYGEPGATGEGYGVTAASDGGYMLCGFYSNSSGAIIQLLKANSGGYLPCNSEAFGLTVSSITLPMQTLSVTTGTSSLTAQDLTLTETSYSNLTTICLGTGTPALPEPAINLSPNPSDGRFTITAPGSYAGAKVTLANTAGVELMRSSFPSGDGSPSIIKTFAIDVPAGVYIVKINDGKHLETRKLFISR
jgi:hypothetical protein